MNNANHTDVVYKPGNVFATKIEGKGRQCQVYGSKPSLHTAFRTFYRTLILKTNLVLTANKSTTGMIRNVRI